MRPLLALLFVSSLSSADSLAPTLQIEPRAGNFLLHVGGTADVPREVALREPALHLEYFFIPVVANSTPVLFPGGLRSVTLTVSEGEPILLGVARARLVPDAVVDPESGRQEPAAIQAEAFAVTGQFEGRYTVRVVFDPGRQSVPLRALRLAPLSAEARASTGRPERLRDQKARLRLELDSDAESARRLDGDLSDLWLRRRTGPRDDPEWSESIAALLDRVRAAAQRNARRPQHEICEFLPAARSALAELYGAIEERAAACDAIMKQEPGARRLPDPKLDRAARRTARATAGLERATRRGASRPSKADGLAALATLRSAPDALRAWHEAWIRREPAHSAADWPAWRAAREDALVRALFTAGRSAPPSSYLDLSRAARALLTGARAGAESRASLFEQFASTIGGASESPLDDAAVAARTAEFEAALSRVESALEKEK